jgi:hypothetical protein
LWLVRHGAGDPLIYEVASDSVRNQRRGPHIVNERGEPGTGFGKNAKLVVTEAT